MCRLALARPELGQRRVDRCGAEGGLGAVDLWQAVADVHVPLSSALSGGVACHWHRPALQGNDNRTDCLIPPIITSLAPEAATVPCLAVDAKPVGGGGHLLQEASVFSPQ